MSKKPVGLKDFKTEMVPLVDLIPYLQNPKAHPAGQVDKIASSIKNFGFLVPLVIDSGNEIIAGHGRLLGAQKLGLGVVPCVRADNLTPAEIKAFRIMDNKSQESEWFPETLAFELKALEEMDFDLGLTGFSMEELEGILTDPYGDTSTERDGQGYGSPWSQVKGGVNSNKIIIGDIEVKIDSKTMQLLTEYLQEQYSNGLSYSETLQNVIKCGVGK